MMPNWRPSSRLPLISVAVLLAALLSAVDARAQLALRINAGGDVPADIIDSNGDLFVADKPFTPGDFGFVGGGPHGPLSGVSGTPDVDLYGALRADPSFSYVFDGLPSGDYEVTLHFIGQRFGAFDVSIEGQVVLANFDPLASGSRVASQQTLIANVQDGDLVIDFAASGLAHVSAISVCSPACVPDVPEP